MTSTLTQSGLESFTIAATSLHLAIEAITLRLHAGALRAASLLPAMDRTSTEHHARILRRCFRTKLEKFF